MAEARALAEYPIHLGLGATAKAQPPFTGMEWYEEYGERNAADGIEDDANLHQVRGRAALVRQGIAVQLANPKPAVFFGTIFLTLVPRDAPIWALAVILLMIFVNDAGWNMIVGRIFAFRRSRATYLNLKTVIDRVFGGLLALLGLKLATT